MGGLEIMVKLSSALGMQSNCNLTGVFVRFKLARCSGKFKKLLRRSGLRTSRRRRPTRSCKAATVTEFEPSGSGFCIWSSAGSSSTSRSAF